jgi:hypothetical protein
MNNYEQIAEQENTRFTKWVETHATLPLSDDDYLAVLEWLKYCIENGDVASPSFAYISELSLDEIVKMVWG